VDRHLPWRADGCIVLSADAASALRGLGVLPENLWQIPPGIAFDVKGKESATLLRDRHGLGDAPVVLYAGNLDQYQDIGLLLQSFRRVVVARPDVRLVLASHSDSDLYRTQAISRGLDQWVHFVGLTDLEELGGWMEISDVAVSPRTVCFGFPIKLLNYMAAGKPIVASAGSAQGIRHLENGWVVSNGDIEAFAQAILTLLEDRALADRLGENAQETANQVYTWGRIVVEIERVYETLVEAKRLT
jgi:glycosyltransferase involved in cell wall biosynthesis